MTSGAHDEDAAERFERLAAQFRADPTVTEGTGFGSAAGLKVRGKIFAMLLEDSLVVKLPKPRVDRLLESGAAMPFGTGRGRPMKEWAAVPMTGDADWAELAAEAFAFVGDLA